MSRREDASGTAFETEQSYRDLLTKSLTSNANFVPGEYSIWDRMCMEELQGMLEKLQSRGAEAMPEVRDAIVQINVQSEYFDEQLNKQDEIQEDVSRLTKSKLELINEAHKLGMTLSNLQSDQVTLTDRVIMSVRLSEITLDVNHLLGAMIYLT